LDNPETTPPSIPTHLATAPRVRTVSDEEREALGRMARSRNLGAGLVRRARIVVHALEGSKAPEIGAQLGLCGATVRHWLKRFNACGL
jgi:hypothetical protein